MQRYRKKPVVVLARQLGPFETEFIATLEGTMQGGPGDWIITGVNNEQYPCKDDIFKKTYELVEENEENV